MQRYVLFKRKKVAYGTYSHWKSYIVRITLTLYEVFDANFLDSRVCNKCSLSVPLDSSNSVGKQKSASEHLTQTQNPKNLTNNLPFRYNSKGNEREE